MRQVLVGLLLLVALPAQAETPYVYQQGVLDRTADGAAVTAVEAQTTMGTRDLRPLGGRGVEQGLRVRHALLDNTTLEAYGGVIWQPEATDLRAGSVGVEVVQRVLSQKRFGVDLQLAGGAYRDVQGVFVPKFRALLGRSWGRLHTQLSALAEIPVSHTRDAVDVILGAAVAYQVTGETSLGVELMGEDLEAIWDPAEAEGGARLLAGPSAHTSWGRLHLHAHAGLTETWYAPGQAPLAGALGRVNLGWRF